MVCGRSDAEVKRSWTRAGWVPDARDAGVGDAAFEHAVMSNITTAVLVLRAQHHAAPHRLQLVVTTAIHAYAAPLRAEKTPCRYRIRKLEGSVVDDESHSLRLVPTNHGPTER